MYDALGRACRLDEPPAAIEDCPPPIEMGELAVEELQDTMNARAMTNLCEYCKERRLCLVVATMSDPERERYERKPDIRFLIVGRPFAVDIFDKRRSFCDKM